MIIIAIEIIILFILIVLSAFFSAAETALTSISKLRIKHLMNERGEKAANLDVWLDNPSRILTVILVLNNIVNIAASSLATFISLNFSFRYSVSIAIGLITLLILILGEISPKNLARKYAEEVAVFAIKPLDILATVFSPIINYLIKISNLFIKLLKLPPGTSQHIITEQEIKMMIDIGQKEGVVEQSEREMLHRIFKFHDTPVKAVMTKREKIVCGQLNIKVKDLLDLIIIEGHSRIPIYEDSLDKILGIIYERDILYLMKEDNLINIQDCLREPFKINEDVLIDDLLHDFQQKKIQIAIVINNLGQTMGLVTIEDLIEEIVGEIDERLTKKVFKKS